MATVNSTRPAPIIGASIIPTTPAHIRAGLRPCYSITRARQEREE